MLHESAGYTWLGPPALHMHVCDRQGVIFRETAPSHLPHQDCKHRLRDWILLIPMADQQVMPLRDRYGECISEAFEKKDGDIDAVKEQRLEEANKLAKGALTLGKERHSSRTFRGLQKVDSSSKKTPSELRTGSTRPGPGGSVPLPQPPTSPATSRVSMGTSVAITRVVEITDSQEVADIRTSLRNHESEILSLRIQLEGTRMEVQDLHKQCRKASKDYANAVCRDDEENLQSFGKREEKLKKLLEQKNQEIDGLQEEIVERKRCEGELREKLAEVEGRDKAREAIPTRTEKTVSDGSDTVEKGNRKGKDKPVCAKQRAIGKTSTGWEFRRRKGENETPLSAGYRILRGTL